MLRTDYPDYPDSNAESAESANSTESATLLGKSPPIRALRARIEQLANSRVPVCISGETGSGKELAARAIHARSQRRRRAFVAVNCGAIPPELVESELFGHLKGSFTGAAADRLGLFQAADGGTLLLDEVGELPLPAQVKLLRVLQERRVRPLGARREVPVDVRLLSATHKDLAKETEQGRMRADLYYRINVLQLAMPSLRQRRSDIPELAAHILQRSAAENGGGPSRLSATALARLQEHSFPGNVRELENILQRAALLCSGDMIPIEALDFSCSPLQPLPADSAAAGTNNSNKSNNSNDCTNDSITDEPGSEPKDEAGLEAGLDARNKSGDGPMADGFSLDAHLQRIEAAALKRALVDNDGNRSAAARGLGLSFRTMRYRLHKHGLANYCPHCSPDSPEE